MALNVVPLLFVALPFVLAMDAMYDLAQDFMLPSDRRGWGLTLKDAKENRLRRALIKYDKWLLSTQAKAFADWLGTKTGKEWKDAYDEELRKQNRLLDEAKDEEDKRKPRQAIRNLQNKLVIKYGVEQAPGLPLRTPKFPVGERKRLGNVNTDEVKVINEKGIEETILRPVIYNLNLPYNELNQLLKELNTRPKMIGDSYEAKNTFTRDAVDNAIRQLAIHMDKLEGVNEDGVGHGSHSGIFKWVVYNEKPEDGVHNMFSWNYPTLLLAGVLINMLGEYYAKFSPMVSGQQAKDLCNIVDHVLLANVAIVLVQLVVSIYYNFDAPNNPDARNPSLDLMDILDHPEDFVSSVLIGLFNHLGTAVLIHAFVRASLGHSLRKSGSPIGGSSRSSRRSRRSSRRRRR